MADLHAAEDFNKKRAELEQDLKERGDDLPPANILVAGITGTGKSTLLNAIFGKNLAETGTGRPVTEHMSEYHSEDIPIRIWDTVGLELDSEKTRKSIGDICAKIAEMAEHPDPYDKVHAIWYCINSNSKRYQGAELEFIKKLHSLGVPFIIVMTQCHESIDVVDAFQREIEKINDSMGLNDVDVVQVMATPYEVRGPLVIEPFGLDELVSLTCKKLPEFIVKGFVAAQKVSQREKRAESEGIIYDYVEQAIGIPICLQDSIGGLEKGSVKSVAIVSNVPSEKSENFQSQNMEKLLDGIVPQNSSEEYTLILLAKPVKNQLEEKNRLYELYSRLSPYSSWQTGYSYNENYGNGSFSNVGVNAGVSIGTGVGSPVSASGNFGVSFGESANVSMQTGKGETTTQTYTNFGIKHTLEIIEAQIKRIEESAALGMWEFAAYVTSDSPTITHNVAHMYRKLVGKAAGLNDDQIVELSKLPTGVAAVYQNDWIEPVLCKIPRFENAQPLKYTPEARGRLPTTLSKYFTAVSRQEKPDNLSGEEIDTIRRWSRTVSSSEDTIRLVERGLQGSLDKENALSDLLSLKPASDSQITEAESQLNTKFAKEYKEYLAAYGAIMADGIELTGIAKSEYRNVVAQTRNEWKLNAKIPHTMYVIENTHIDGIIIWQDSDGIIYKSAPDTNPTKIAESLTEYISKFAN